jgi:hypothetical protein
MTSQLPTTDDDLMDLASRTSYLDSARMEERTEVNGVRFKLVHAIQDPATGLDAFTFRNVSTGELTVGFQGTAGLVDTLTDAQLVTALTPAQYRAAEAYVLGVEADLGRPVSSVCGNSLGGGLAAYVAATHPRIRAVTVNPAPVPAELAGAVAPQVRNYITETDVLHRSVVAGGLADRVIGEQITVRGTSFHLSYLVANHIGSDRDDGVYDASMSVPFSLFHPGTVIGSGGYGAKVDLDLDALAAVVRGLHRQREDLLAVLDGELVGMQRELRAYGAEVDDRADRARDELVDLAESVYAPVRRTVGDVADGLCSWLVSVEVHVPFLPAWTRQRPLAGLGVVLSRATGVAQRVGDLTARGAAELAWQAYATAFVEESRILTHALGRQARVVCTDLGLVDRKWVVLARSTKLAALAVQRADEAVATAIASRTCPPDAVEASVPAWPGGQVDPLGEDAVKQVVQTVVDARQLAVGELVTGLARTLAQEVSDVLAGACALLGGLLETVRLALASAVASARSAVHLAGTGAPGVATRALGVRDDLERFRDAVVQLERDFGVQADEWQDHLWRVGRTVGRLPDAVQDLRVYLDSTFFSDAMIEDVYDGLLRCRNLVDRSATSFGEVEHQLADHKSRLIDALAGNASDVRRDLVTTRSSLTEMIR